MNLINVKLERFNAGMTMTEIAKKLEVTRQTYDRWEKDPGKMPASKYFKVLDIFNIKFVRK